MLCESEQADLKRVFNEKLEAFNFSRSSYFLSDKRYAEVIEEAELTKRK